MQLVDFSVCVLT